MDVLRGIIHVASRCLIIVAAAHLLLGCSATSPRKTPPPEQADRSAVQMTQEELQAAVISYANRFFATVGQAAFRFEDRVQSKEGRLIASARKVYSLSAVAEIAAGPNPGPSLLDLVVVTTLNRMVWDEYWRPQVFGAPASIMVDAFTKMEDEAWKMAAQVMPPPQTEELRELILDWYYDHPGQVAVDYIRFSDFGELGKKPNLREIQKPGGLLAPVSEATRAVDEVRLTSERAMFLLTKMQIIMGFQAEQVYRQMVAQPEMEELLEDVTRFRTTTERLAVLLERLPEQVSTERSAALGDLSRLVAAERTAILAAFDDRQRAINGLVKEVQATIDRADNTFLGLQRTTADIERLRAGTEKTALVFNDLVESVDRVAARFVPAEPMVAARLLDIDEVNTALTQLQETVKEMNKLVKSVEQSSSPVVAAMTDQINAAAQERIDHIFRRLAQLSAILGAIGLVLILTNHFMKKRSAA